MLIVRTKTEVDDAVRRCETQIAEGGSKYPGMSFEEGCVAMFKWLTGESDNHPYKDE